MFVARIVQAASPACNLVARMVADGHDTALPEELLDTMGRTLAAMRAHRELILREIVGEL